MGFRSSKKLKLKVHSPGSVGCFKNLFQSSDEGTRYTELRLGMGVTYEKTITIKKNADFFIHIFKYAFRKGKEMNIDSSK